MGMAGYLTRCISVIIFGNGRFRIDENDLLICGEYDSKEIKRAFEELKQSGWNMVAVIDRNYTGLPRQADAMIRDKNNGKRGKAGLDIYFRRIVAPGTL